MTVRLLIRQRAEAGGNDKPEELLLDQDAITFGRERGCEVVLAQQAVSRKHARITQDGKLCFVEDLDSAYGTKVNNEALPKGQKKLLRNGDVIAIAQYDISFERVQQLEGGANGQSDRTAFVARQAVRGAMRGVAGKSADEPYFRFMNGPREGEHLPLADAQEITVGRDPGLELVLPNDDLVSRRHATIRRDWSGTHVEDLGSRNGIRVNRKKYNRKTLEDKDELEIGNTRLLYVDPTSAAPELSRADEPSSELSQATGHSPDEEAAEKPPVSQLSDAPKPAEAAKAPEPEPPPPEPEPEPEPSEIEDSSALSQGEDSALGDEPMLDEADEGEAEHVPLNFSTLMDPRNRIKVIVLGAGALLTLAIIGIIIAAIAGA